MSCALFAVLVPGLALAQPSAHWTLDDGMGSTASDDSANALDATLMGGPVWLGGGAVSGALAFDGVDDFGFVDDPGPAWPLDISTQLSVAAWVRPAAVGSLQSLISKDGAYELEIGRAGSGTYGLRLVNDQRGAGQTLLQANAWQHVAVTWDGFTVTYYYNGVADGTFSWSGSLPQNNRDVGFAGRPPTYGAGFANHLFTGTLDDLRIYSYALDASEVAALEALGGGLPGVDLDPPIRSNGSPSGSVLVGTTSVNLSLTTDENAECRYSTSSGVGFASMMNVFQTTGSTSHGTTVTGINDYTTYDFYVRCRDQAFNANGDDSVISFVTDGMPAGDGSPPVIFMVAPSGTLPSGTTMATLQVKTNEAAECRYDTQYNTTFAAMSEVFDVTGGVSHSSQLTALEDLESYLYYVRCRDLSGEASSEDLGVAFFVAGPQPAGFHPTELDGVRFFVESRHGLTLARCPAPECLAEHDSAAIAQQYCDLSIFPEGCVRRWEDQSPYAPMAGFTPPEWLSGRDFGQDDPDKPGFVPNCLNGYPCIRGGVGATQELSFETEPEQPVDAIEGPFSVYLVARPVAQPAWWTYFGFAGSELRHRPSDNALRLRIGFGTVRTISLPGAVSTGDWHLIEIHRDGSDTIRTVVDGIDVSPGSVVVPGGFRFRHLMSVSRARSMHGDLASTLVVAGATSASDEIRARYYFGELYDLSFLDVESEGGQLVGGWEFEDAGGCTLTNSSGGPDAIPGPACPGSAPQPVAGAVGTALEFSVNGHEVVAGSDAALNLLSEITLSAWVRTTTNIGWRAILDKRDSAADGFDLFLAPGALPFVRLDGDTLVGSTNLDDGQWHHLALTYDGVEMVLYVDGLPEASQIAPGIVLDTSADLVMGRNYVAGFSQFIGSLDQARVYDTALTWVQVLALASE